MRKVVFILPVYYDDTKTNGLEISTVLDQLLVSGMSTHGILDICANPEIGKFETALDTHWPEEDTDIRYLVGLGNVDGVLLAQQRLLVSAMATYDFVPLGLAKDRQPLLEGLTNFLDVIADQLHDRYGVPCLMEDEHAEEEAESGKETTTQTPGSDAHRRAHGGHALTPNDMDEPTDPD